MITPPIVQLLLDAGFTDGWALDGETLVLWEHDAETGVTIVRGLTAEEIAAMPKENNDLAG